MSNYAINLFTRVKESATAPLGNYTAQMRNWRDTTRAIGGYYQASADFWMGKGDPLVSFNEAYEMFVAGMHRRVVRSVGSKTIWEGFISGMTLTHNGRTYQKSCPVNAVKAIYTRYGSNLIYNGSAELTGVYSPTEGGPVGGPTDLWYRTTGGGGGGAQPLVTRTPRATWATDGAWSYYIDNDVTGTGTAFARFVIGGPSMSPAGLTLCLVARVRTLSAASIEIQARVNSVVLFSYTTPAVAGEYTIIQTFDAPAGATTGISDVRFVDNAGGQCWYVDGVQLLEAGTRCDTAWSINAGSVAQYGTIEHVILDAGSTDAAAASRVARYLRENAWAWPTGPDSESIEAANTPADGMQIDCSGYVFSLGFKNYAGTAGVAVASTHIANLVADSEFVTAGTIETNALSAHVELAETIKIWDSIEKIVSAGDVSGYSWMGGVKAGRVFDYGLRPSTVTYIIKSGRWHTADMNLVDPALIAPGYVHDGDLPALPGTITGDVRDDPAVLWANEVEFIAPDKVNITYAQERD